MSRNYKIAIAAAIVIVAAYAGWRIREAHRAAVSGLLTENIVHNGDTWTADFTARVAAPESAVFDAVRNIEKSHSDQVRSVRVISASDDSKTVEMDLAYPGGQQVTMRLQFQYLPAEHRITYRSLDNPMMATAADYHFTDEGGSTLIKLHQTSKFGQALPVPDAFVRQIIHSTFIAQLDGLRRALNLTAAAEPEDTGDEP
jgi:hypothetical protein